MTFFSPDQVSGQTINLWQSGGAASGARASDRGAFGVDGSSTAATPEGFGQMLLDGLENVNELQQQHAKLAVQAIVDPKSVNAHDIAIAEAKANMALSITKNVVDRVIRAYQDIINVR